MRIVKYELKRIRKEGRKEGREVRSKEGRKVRRRGGRKLSTYLTKHHAMKTYWEVEL